MDSAEQNDPRGAERLRLEFQSHFQYPFSLPKSIEAVPLTLGQGTILWNFGQSIGDFIVHASLVMNLIVIADQLRAPLCWRVVVLVRT